jgi:hypothetical protein
MTTQYLDFIELKQSSPVANITFGALSFNYKDLPVVHGKLMPGDLTIHERNDSEPFSLGLYAKAPPGKYTARFWLKIDALSQGRVFSISIDDFNKTNLAQKEIFAEDFDQRESWQCFSLDFVMGNFTSIVEIRGIGSRDSLTSFSYVDLENQE